MMRITIWTGCLLRVIFDRDEASSKSRHVGCALESRSRIKSRAACPRVHDRRVLNGIVWVLRSCGARGRWPLHIIMTKRG